MKRLIYADDSPKRFKVGDDNTNLTVIPVVTTDEVNTLVKFNKNANVKVLVRNENTYITSITPVVNDNGIVINSKKLGKIPAGQYFLELWVTDDNETTVYPDRGFLPFFVNENAEGETGSPITNVNADDLRNELKEWVTDQLKIIQGSEIDLSNYFTKDEVNKLVDNSKVDLSPYLKTVDADNKYLSKESIVLDLTSRTLTLNGTVINIPSTVDLSSYAKKDSVPSLSYNSQSNTLTLNGTDIKLGSTVDLSNYFNKEEVTNLINNSQVDLTPYLKTADANNNYLPKGSVVLDASARTLTVNGTVINIPSAVDLTGYAKTDAVPSLTYDNQSNTLTLNGTPIKLGSNVDLSNFYTKNEIDSKLSHTSSGTNVNDVINKLGITQFKTNFSPTLDNGSVVSYFDNAPRGLNLRTYTNTHEFLTLTKKGTTDTNPKPNFDDLNNAQDITSLEGVTLLNGYRWLTILQGYGFKSSTAFSFPSAWFFNSSLPYLSIRIVAYDVNNKKYVAVNNDNTGEPIIHLLPLTSPLTEGDFNNGAQVLMYAGNDDNWIITDIIYNGSLVNDFTRTFLGSPLYQAVNTWMTGNPDPRGATNLVRFNGTDNDNGQAENTAPVTFFFTNLTGSLMKLGDETLDAQTALVYQYADKTTGMFELKLSVPNNVDNWLISCYKGRHLVPFMKQVDSNGELYHMTTSNDAFTPVYNGGPTTTQKEVTLYPFGIEPVHITFTN